MTRESLCRRDSPVLETDRKNWAEYHRSCVSEAVKHYHALRLEGYTPSSARAMSVRYLMRKTRWTLPAAAGEFDNATKELSS